MKNWRKQSCLFLAYLLSLLVPFSVAGAQNLVTDTVPVKLVDGWLFVPVTVGDSMYHFVLDTGAEVSFIGKAVQKKQDLLSGCTTVVMDANGSRKGIDRLGTIEMGTGRFKSSFVAYKLPEDSPVIGAVDGILGSKFFDRGYAVKIDVRQGIMVMTRSRTLFDQEGGYAIKYKGTNDRMRISVRVSPGIQLRSVLFDTGYKGLFRLSPVDFQSIMRSRKRRKFEHQLVDTVHHESHSLFGMHATDSALLVRLDSMVIGGMRYAFYDVPVTVNNFSSNTKVGARILEHGALIVYPWHWMRKKRMVFQPYAR